MSKFMFYTSGEKAMELDIYQSSVQVLGSDIVFMADAGYGDVIVTTSNGSYRKMEICHETAMYLRKNFPFTAPGRVMSFAKTVGMGDRLGIASEGHIASVDNSAYAPVLAQQSISELKLTDRSYEDVLDAATFAVFKSGYKKPWGADADHLKKPEDIEYALSCGFTMLTLDCSEYIKTGAESLSDAELNELYTPSPELESIYIGKSFEISHDITISYNERSYKEAAVIYGAALDFIEDMYALYIQNGNRDFEISIDETSAPTTPAQHFFIANELARRGVKFDTLAPRFCGEFWPGIDYIGDLKQFETEFAIHAAIAEKFDYKLSIHGSSDKFSVLPLIGSLSKGRFHIKTSGTSWLEAMKLIAKCEPELYREVHAFALGHFEEIRTHCDADINSIPALAELSDEQLPCLLDNNDVRQLMHAAYGLILSARDDNGDHIFRARLYAAWRIHREEYKKLLTEHIGRHIAQLDSLTDGLRDCL